MQDTRIERLQQMAIFGGITEETLNSLLRQGRIVEAAAGQHFLREGDSATGLFVLLEGRVAVRRRWGEREMLLRELGPGDCFGEMALLDLRPRSASIQAMEPSAALELGSGILLELFEQDAKQFALIQMNIARELSRRLRRTYDLLFGASSEGERAVLARILRRS